VLVVVIVAGMGWLDWVEQERASGEMQRIGGRCRRLIAGGFIRATEHRANGFQHLRTSSKNGWRMEPLRF
jgi:hypothetical protein